MIKVLVDCRLESGKNGGVEQAIIGLARSMKETSITDIEFYWLLCDKNVDWIQDYLPKNSIVLKIPSNAEFSKIKKRIITEIRNRHQLNRIVTFLRKYGPFKYEIEEEPKIVRDVNPDLIHFPFQFGFRTNIPSIYQPHDLQHIHLEENFTAEEIYLRNLVFSEMIRQSNLVILGNEWTKKDFTSHFPDQSSKFVNVALYPQFLEKEVNPRITRDPYLLYPAAGWKHKNHIRLLQAFKLMTAEYPEVKLVLTGTKLNDNKVISREISNLGITDQVLRLGFVSPSKLAYLYSHAIGVIIPTLFESASFPVWEAFEIGVPVAASNVTSIASQVGGAAILFDPYSISEIYKAMKRLIADGEGNASRIEEGKVRISLITPENTAYGYRYFYRRALGLKLDDADNHWNSTKFVF